VPSVSLGTAAGANPGRQAPRAVARPSAREQRAGIASTRSIARDKGQRVPRWQPRSPGQFAVRGVRRPGPGAIGDSIAPRQLRRRTISPPVPYRREISIAVKFEGMSPKGSSDPRLAPIEPLCHRAAPVAQMKAPQPRSHPLDPSGLPAPVRQAAALHSAGGSDRPSSSEFARDYFRLYSYWHDELFTI